jgi:hypothetical protein
MKPSFSLYAIQIDRNPEILYLNYSMNVDQSYKKFLYKCPQIPHSVLRPELCADYSGFHTSRQALRAALHLIESLESRGFEIIAGGPLLQSFWQTYVIEIDGDPKHVYVGETNYPREKRFQQHIYKFHSARALRRYDILTLAEDLCDNHKYLTKYESLAAEKQKAAELRTLGYRVEGGT